MARILVVDDSAPVRSQLHKVLSEAGFDVELASDGQVGLEKLISGRKYDLVIADYMMPSLDGFTMLQKTIEKFGKLPFPTFMHTAETSSVMKQEGRAMGVTAWIIKPFISTKLVDAVKIVTSRSAG